MRLKLAPPRSQSRQLSVRHIAEINQRPAVNRVGLSCLFRVPRHFATLGSARDALSVPQSYSQSNRSSRRPILWFNRRGLSVRDFSRVFRRETKMAPVDSQLRSAGRWPGACSKTPTSICSALRNRCDAGRTRSRPTVSVIQIRA
jgi:hypothetical protein